MKKNKGFTLVELLAVIVILGILVGIAIPVYFNIFKNVKENEYYAKKKFIEEIAVRYAEENSIYLDENDELTLFTPVKLITAGFLSAEKYISYNDGEIPFIENPMNVNDNLVCHVISLKVEDYSYYAELSETDTDINCDIASQEVNESRIGIKAYEIKEDNTLDSEMIPSINNYFKWVKNDIALIINPNIDFEIISYDFGGKNYTVNKNNMFTGNAAGINKDVIKNYSNVIIINGINGAEISSEYKFMVRISSNQDVDNVYSTTINVRIDKRAPRVDNYQSEMWTNGKLETLVYINDGSGSGSKGLCYNKMNNRSNATCVDVENIESTLKSKSVKVRDLENGNLYLWPIDIVGNEPTIPTVIEVKNVDITSPAFEELTWIIDSDISCDNGVQCINPADTTCTCRKQTVSNDVIYDRSRKAIVKFSDDQSGIKKINYCITEEDSCSLNNEIYGTFINGKMEAEIPWTNNQLPQKICYNAVDNVSNESDIRCTDKYNVDATQFGD